MYWTKRTTLEVCRNLWQWLAHNPDKEKWDWPEWKDNGGKIPECHANCPVCVYAGLHKGRCIDCLLWGKGKELKGRDCMDINSPYWIWRDTEEPTIRREVALEIVAACNRALAKLKK